MMQRIQLFVGGLLATAVLAQESPKSQPVEAALAQAARQFKAELADKVLPYWLDTCLDLTNGGYLLADPGPTREKQLVTQTRMIWGFAHAHLKGLSDGKRNYLKAAEHGYRFLLAHFLDRENGGYYWKTDLAGQVTQPRKILYGESFAIYGLVEYYRASGDKAALTHALELYQVIQKRAHDAKSGGWYEHFQRDWQPILQHDNSIEVEVGGLKSANTHLHLMEALTELYDASKNPAVKKSLAEALKLNAQYFYPKDAGESCFHRNPDWSVVADPKSAGLSYGHNVEFAWLMVRAEKTLGQRPSWKQFQAHVDHALKYGYDWQRGGLYSRGMDNQPASDTSKVWWAEAELIAALSDAWQHQPEPAYGVALQKQIQFLREHQIDSKDGIWSDTVTAEGQPKSPSKAHSWKANYHDVRAIVKFIEVFGVQVKPSP